VALNGCLYQKLKSAHNGDEAARLDERDARGPLTTAHPQKGGWAIRLGCGRHWSKKEAA
jgi:hypothetical protein